MRGEGQTERMRAEEIEREDKRREKKVCMDEERNGHRKRLTER